MAEETEATMTDHTMNPLFFVNGWHFLKDPGAYRGPHPSKGKGNSAVTSANFSAQGLIGDISSTGFQPKERVICATAILSLVSLDSRRARLGVWLMGEQ